MTATRFGPAGLLCYPMHGHHKLISEGYRTRDGHIIEWSARLSKDPVAVISRPEPAPIAAWRATKKPRRAPAENTQPISRVSWRVPNFKDPRRWWYDSRHAYPNIPRELEHTPAIVWNPFVALISSPKANPFTSERTVVLDLLDDWSVHYAFSGLKLEVERAYREAFEGASYVTANAEGTVDLARRFGRDDVVFLPNGCDPERFSSVSVAEGPTTIGYVGKIGRRLDLEGIIATARALPQMRFLFAGPILDPEYRAPMEALDNLELLGDVHYDDVPSLLQRFDVGWVPHRVGDGEVGGDVIKTYEYRAAGLPVVSTPVAGAGNRGLDAVVSEPIEFHASRFRALVGPRVRVQRIVSPLPPDVAWRGKAERILSLARSASESGQR